MTVRRNAGSVKINGVSYLISKDNDGAYIYNRKSTPKAQLTTGRRGTASGEANMLEYSWGADEGMGDAVQNGNRDHYAYAMNFFMEHEGEAVVLPGALRHELSSGSVEPFKNSVGVFEIVDDPAQQDALSTYWLQDCMCLKIAGAAAPEFTYTIDKTFETKTNPTDVKVYNNIAYIAMGAAFRRVTIASVANNGSGKPRFATTLAHKLAVGDLIRIDLSSHTTAGLYNGYWVIDTVSDTTHFDVNALTYAASSTTVPVTAVVYKVTNRYLRRRQDDAWSKDDNSYVSISAAASDGGAAKFTTSASHGYSVGDYVYIVNSTVNGYNSMTRDGISTLYQITAVADVTHFTIGALTYSATATAKVNRQDSDVQAEYLEVVGDTMVRGWQTASGWQTSRVDIANSNPMLEANWTAGVGTKGVSDGNNPITDIVAVGEGELIMAANGAFTYDKKAAAYLNQIPELEEHRHPTNGKNSFEWKGWVYIPTIVGVFRWKNGTTQNVTPGRGGQSDFTIPLGPIGAFAGDTERLYAAIQPFKVNQPKNIVAPAPTRMYLDPTGVGPADNSSDWATDPQQDLNGFTASGYLYVGCTKKWHRMYFELDPQANMASYGTTYNGLDVDAVEYWNGSAWVAETNWVDMTLTRYDSAGLPMSMAQNGDIWMPGTVPSTWALGGTSSAPGSISLNASYYWRRISFDTAISNSVIIKRIIAGLHDDNSTFAAFSGTDLQVDHGGAQFILSMTEEQGKGVVWETMWGWQPDEQTQSDGTNTFNAAGTQPIGTLAIVQPNKLRSSAGGTRFLFVGGYNTNYLCPLGHVNDPTEDGPYMQVFNSVGENGLTAVRKAILVLPDTDCGLPYINKTLQEINFDVDGISAATDIVMFYRVDGGAWTSVGTVSALPHKMTAGSEPNGLMFGLAVVITLTESTYVSLPRLTTLPALRLFARPEMSELITMTVELDAETVLPGQSDRRVNKTSYAALQTLQTGTSSVAYVDVDETAEHVHVQQVAKRVVYNGENIPRVVADLIMSVVP